MFTPCTHLTGLDYDDFLNRSG
ncbi:unnamed protein product [Arabidopsis thaliana]|uniref:At4g11211 n=4 Tax=Arabidopsis TaxID=3701 RepID=Q3EA55_ARATH|nr:uncharacterized protein AT4G11211 [Arabidopsis thaliana]KAG7615572.1 hypothetical protein ISN45_At04g011260 [Arabidopsis thaliana x Arabidopsis arenosa]KAG7620070.1 hypothetical protein ISN44_As04g010880 [Arabidopsis suecica]ABJ17129.1 At4g11211 [Arabidopsis thaliana]AEE82985.1 hypothetical protein AT4G11211 [Arabidopsis thaliana]CAA0394649.1 unnamed protein product [Arabidopsis thaliana]|eukprot:NP_001336506.1 hypothetical protein AT4G11211 [Arabidopsis thaliana]